MLEQCPTCNEFIYTSGHHKCLPVHVVSCEEEGYEGTEIHAIDAESAAESFGKYYDDCDYPLANGEDIEVLVIDLNGVKTFWNVWAEQDVNYYARAVDKSNV